ncbi:MAG: VOC family protein [Kineosporiaceae bacterium]
MTDQLVPVLTFLDGERSLAFLTDGLGFEVLLTQRSETGGLRHAELRRGDAVVMGGEGDARPAAAPGLYLVVEDVDAAHRHAVAAGAAEVEPPHDLYPGMRRARLRDPDGHEWSLSTYRPGRIRGR